MIEESKYGTDILREQSRRIKTFFWLGVILSIYVIKLPEMSYVEGLVVDRCTELINKLTRPYLSPSFYRKQSEIIILLM